MKKTIQTLCLALCAVVFISISACKTSTVNNPKNLKLITIGTGGINGVYYPVGKSIAEIIDKNKGKIKYNAVAKTSYNASKYNIVDILNGDLDFGISQVDDLYNTFRTESKGKKLRAIFCLHVEALTLLALDSSGIKNYKDIKGHKLRTGPTDNISQNIKAVLDEYNINKKDFTQIKAKSLLCPNLLQNKKIDAYFFTVGHPNQNTKDAISGKNKVNMISLDSKIIDKLLTKYPFYSKVSIPLSYYMPSKGEVETVGTKAVFFTSADTDVETVYEITKEVFSHLQELTSSAPALMGLNEQDMVTGYLLPLHKGAEKFYKEKGITYVSGE